VACCSGRGGTGSRPAARWPTPSRQWEGWTCLLLMPGSRLSAILAEAALPELTANCGHFVLMGSTAGQGVSGQSVHRHEGGCHRLRGIAPPTARGHRSFIPASRRRHLRSGDPRHRAGLLGDQQRVLPCLGSWGAASGARFLRQIDTVADCADEFLMRVVWTNGCPSAALWHGPQSSPLVNASFPTRTQGSIKVGMKARSSGLSAMK
jgi:hypothetical protein